MLGLDAIEARFVGVSPSEEEQAILDLIARIREQDAEIERLERQLELERGERREKDIAAACDHLHETIHRLRGVIARHLCPPASGIEGGAMKPERIAELRKALEVYTRDKESLRYAQMHEDMSARMTCQHDVEESESELAELLVEHAADLLATAEREAKLREALRSCLSCMEIQEHREDESFHLSVEAFRPMWDEAKANAVAALESKGGSA